MQQKDALLTKPDTSDAGKRGSGTSAEPEHMNGARAVIRSLLAEGVETIFGYPGGAIMPIYDELYHFLTQVNHILTRHEQGAIHAAQGYARTSGKVGVVFATSGPGATNLVTGLADAMVDSTPLVCITGQVASHLLGTDAFQETDVVNVTIPVTKWNIQVTRPEDIAEAIAKAFYIAASGRPGPVVVDITKDAQSGKTDYQYHKCERIKTYQPVPKLDPEQIKAAATLINSAKKPYMLVGQGVLLSGAMQEAIAFAEKADLPVASTLLGLSAFPVDHPLYMGFLGMHGNYACNRMMDDCDVLIAVGMRFDDRITGDVKRYATQAKVIHIELDRAEINKIIHAEVGVHADAREALSALTPLVEAGSHKDWIAAFEVLKQEEYDKIVGKDWFPGEGKIKMGEAVHLLSEKTGGEAVIVTDVGQHQMVASRYYAFKQPRSNVTSGGMGTMGFGLPAAMGAALGVPDREVIAIMGDGGFQMTLQELGTIAENKIPVKMVILNNHFLGMVRQWQQLFFEKRYSFTDITGPDFVKLADAYNIPGKRVEQRGDLEAAIGAMLDHKGPYLLEISVEKEENVFPFVPAGAAVSDMLLECPK
ncbi:MAG TPA: biosynthetic-type acetolactate synthase large subunit [Chitinophagaceae bacterium]|nr:biosynthetic-type acetolactate synthase large subunit [Chitinophagaceae bacterium]